MNTILSEIKNKVGIITLNSEKSLNSLSLEMINQIQQLLESWKTSDEVRCVFIQGAGEKAFCAGGDVRKLHDAIVEEQAVENKKLPQACLEFFTKEYQVDYTIHTYPKPVIIWGHGIVMGGGIGLMVGASHRVVTERSKLAMPEITIGLYPDVAGTWFLNRMPSAYGLYLGLTGARLSAEDCMFLDLADYYIPSTSKESVLQVLETIEWNADAHKIVDELLKKQATEVDLSKSEAKKHRSFIEKFEGVTTIESFENTLLNAEKDEWIEAGVKSFTTGSPSSAHVILKQLNDYKNASIEEVFQSELNLSCQCCIHPDFVEGVRALLVDKDQNPKWQPAKREDVTEEWVAGYFKPLWSANEHPLKHLKN